MPQISLLDLPSHVIWAKYQVAYKEWMNDDDPQKPPSLQKHLSEEILIAYLQAVVQAAEQELEFNVKMLKLYEVFLLGGYAELKVHMASE